MRAGVAYDSKAVTAAAHGYQFGVPLDPAEFSGGAATVEAKLRELGFEVVPEPPPRGGAQPGNALGPLQGLLEQALALQLTAFDEEFRGHPLAALLVRDIPGSLEPWIDEPGYKIQGSPGRGRWAGTVWVAIFDRLVTTTAQRGYYLVYLFRNDGTTVYLSLNQGTTAVHAEVGGRRYLHVLRDRSNVYAGLLSSEDLTGLQQGAIDLGGDGRLTRGYEEANVLAYSYRRGSIPDDSVLRRDVERLLGLYTRLIEANNHLADADTPADVDEGSTTAADAPDGGDEPGAALDARRLRWHQRAERNPKLARDAKRVHGVNRAVCGFSYGECYGALGEGYIEEHHLAPLAELSERPTTLDPRHDFAVVCASCHRMIHRRRPPYDLDTIREALGPDRR
jgi:5-methylcytosine-specific restriction protein A